MSICPIDDDTACAPRALCGCDDDGPCRACKRREGPWWDGSWAPDWEDPGDEDALDAADAADRALEDADEDRGIDAAALDDCDDIDF